MNLYRSVWVPNEEIYRFNANMSESEDETRQRLKAAVHYTVGRMCHKLGEEHRREFSRQVVAAIAETAFRQCDIFAKDLEAFAKHAKRCTVSAEDVKLLARRSTALSVHIQRKSEEVEQVHKALKKRRKSKETDKNRE
ncbi:centromere protein S isoform X2 [Phycodurus eques]|uniref:centromere protein S isoform X2 n=1 Tax=Phycodurus eques TaxID=693459 RepID=UPI002ACD1FCA|nr:centromere protein S isoform X2 [Phycodurus eques]